MEVTPHQQWREPPCSVYLSNLCHIWIHFQFIPFQSLDYSIQTLTDHWDDSCWQFSQGVLGRIQLAIFKHTFSVNQKLRKIEKLWDELFYIGHRFIWWQTPGCIGRVKGSVWNVKTLICKMKPYFNTYEDTSHWLHSCTHQLYKVTAFHNSVLI